MPLPVLDAHAWLTVLNVGVAALLMALFLAFATDRRARESLVNLQRVPGRWRRGIAVAASGVVVMGPAMVPGLLTGVTRDWVQAAGYPLVYAGIILMASATWGVPVPRASPRELADPVEGGRDEGVSR